MKQLFEWLNGKKSYIIACATAVLGALQGCGILVVPDWVYVILTALFGVAIRDAVNSVANTVKPK